MRISDWSSDVCSSDLDRVSAVPKNVAISVRDRLVARARSRRENAQLLMTHYVIERLLYRLSRSQHRDRFILKGAMLFSLWADAPYRATGDLDLLGAGENTPDKLATIFQEIFADRKSTSLNSHN